MCEWVRGLIVNHRCVLQTRDGRVIGEYAVDPIDGYLPRIIVWAVEGHGPDQKHRVVNRVFIADAITTREVTYYRECDAYFPDLPPEAPQ